MFDGNDTTCTTAQMQYVVGNTLTVGTLAVMDDGNSSYPFDVTDGLDAVMIPLTAAAVENLNTGVCGVTDWALNVEQNLTGCADMGSPQPWDDFYTLILVNDAKTDMYFGDTDTNATLDGSTAEKRPVAIDYDYSATK